MSVQFAKTSLLLFLAVTVVSMGCRKNSDTPEDPSPVPVVNKLAKLEFSNGDYDSLFYNEDGTVNKIKAHTVTPAPYDEIFLYTYTGDKKVARISDNNGDYYEYKYQNNQLTSVSHYRRGQKEDFKLYDYEDNKLTTIEEYYRETPGSIGYLYTSERKFFYFPNGNLKQEVQYSFDAQRNLNKDLTINYLEYDTQVNPIEPLGRFLYLSQVPMAKNNVRKYNVKSQATGNLSEFSFEYTYNDFSNPLTHTMVYTDNGVLHTETVKYHYY